jgi:hypothetical protein
VTTGFKGNCNSPVRIVSFDQIRTPGEHRIAIRRTTLFRVDRQLLINTKRNHAVLFRPAKHRLTALTDFPPTIPTHTLLPGDVFGLLDNAFGLLIDKLLEVLDLQPPAGEQAFHDSGSAERQIALEEHPVKAGDNPPRYVVKLSDEVFHGVSSNENWR